MEYLEYVFTVAAVGWLLIGAGMVWAAFIGERDQWGPISRVAAVLAFLLPLAWILNDYLGNETMDGVVTSVSKVANDGAAKVEVSTSIKAEFGASPEILKPFEVAIYPTGTKKLRILSNTDSIFRLKFNKRELQLQLEAGKRYRFRLHRLFRQKNILDIEPL